MTKSKNYLPLILTTLVTTALWASVLWFFLLASQEQYNEAFENGYSQGSSSARVEAVKEEEINVNRLAKRMPLYLQTDTQWRYLPYSVGTIETYGCGLTSLSMALTYLTGERILPEDLIQYQEYFLTDDVNDPDRMCEWASDKYGLEWSGEQWLFSQVDDMLKAHYVVLASMSGTLGDSSYGGHIVLIYGHNEEGWLIRDPDSGYNSSHVFTDQELSGVIWGSFNGLKDNILGY